MGYDKGNEGWYFKICRPQRALATPTAAPPPRTHDQGSSQVRYGIQSIKEKVNSLDQRITRIEEHQEKSSRGVDPMDINSAPRSEDDSSEKEIEDEEEESEEEESEEEEGQEESQEDEEKYEDEETRVGD
ncbi:uncharacterized protein LOC131166771 [Malania oleifera]|uniref:uncharacterized protein LOC131166771 n=1 Tax=Malania oleifera TaxID=397392 RepID=UPI0025ADBBA3|nr:uncharacterized protein LOC131166771 [Malania oleifera]